MHVRFLGEQAQKSIKLRNTAMHDHESTQVSRRNTEKSAKKICMRA